MRRRISRRAGDLPLTWRLPSAAREALEACSSGSARRRGLPSRSAPDPDAGSRAASARGRRACSAPDRLLAELRRLAACERAATANLLASLIEMDGRRLYLREGCSSLFTYCTQVLHLAEGAAYNRIEAARAARRFPPVLDAIADGSLTLTSARLLAPHLTTENHRAVLDAARHKSKREIELLIATLQPKPPVATVVRKVPLAPSDGGRKLNAIRNGNFVSRVPSRGAVLGRWIGGSRQYSAAVPRPQSVPRPSCSSANRSLCGNSRRVTRRRSRAELVLERVRQVADARADATGESASAYSTVQSVSDFTSLMRCAGPTPPAAPRSNWRKPYTASPLPAGRGCCVRR